ncbi:MAG: ornithine cyclodeaminase [Clostridia bacterium]|nr:ornithine cyclodeaminase [Clostridia bacterium]
MKLITFSDIQSLSIPPRTCYDWVEKALLSKSNSLLPPKIHMNMDGNIFCNVMPSIVNLDGSSWCGIKTVTRYPQNTPSLESRLLLLDAERGEYLALMDATWITAMRTGAVAAHSIMTFANPGFKTIGMIGLGNTARAALEILSSVVNGDLDIKLLRYKDQAEQFNDRFSGNNKLHFSIVDDVKNVVKGSEVVVSCATYFADDICSDDCFDEGVLVVPVHTRGFTNCDLFFDKVFADDRGHVDHFKNFAKFKYFAEVSDVICGKANGRTSNKERILAYNIGISLHDVYFAAEIFNMLKNRRDVFESLLDLEFNEPKAKFWV